MAGTVIPALFLVGCHQNEYVSWGQEWSLASSRAETVFSDSTMAGTIAFSTGSAVPGTDLAFEPDSLIWTAPNTGIESKVALSGIDSVRVVMGRRWAENAYIGGVAGAIGVGVLAGAACVQQGPCSEELGGLAVVTLSGGLIGAILGGLIGWASRDILNFIP